MDHETRSFYDDTLNALVQDVAALPIDSPKAKDAYANLEKFYQSVYLPHVEQTDTIPLTRWGKAKKFTKDTFHSQTFQVVVKSGLAFGSTAAVIRATVRRDHQLEKTAMQQSNQNPQ